MTLGFRPNFVEYPPTGLLDGQAGASAFVEVRGSRERDDPVILKKGERVRVRTAGGGGIGDPLERSLEKVAADLAASIISRRHAEEIYGVVLDEAGQLNPTLSQQERERRRRVGVAQTNTH